MTSVMLRAPESFFYRQMIFDPAVYPMYCLPYMWRYLQSEVLLNAIEWYNEFTYEISERDSKIAEKLSEDEEESFKEDQEISGKEKRSLEKKDDIDMSRIVGYLNSILDSDDDY